MARGARLDGPGIASVDVDGDGAGSGIVDIEIDVFSVDLLALIGADEIAAGVVALAQETGLVSAVAGEEGRIVPAVRAKTPPWPLARIRSVRSESAEKSSRPFPSEEVPNTTLPLASVITATKEPRPLSHWK